MADSPVQTIKRLRRALRQTVSEIRDFERQFEHEPDLRDQFIGTKKRLVKVLKSTEGGVNGRATKR